MSFLLRKDSYLADMKKSFFKDNSGILIPLAVTLVHILRDCCRQLGLSLSSQSSISTWPMLSQGQNFTDGTWDNGNGTLEFLSNDPGQSDACHCEVDGGGRLSLVILQIILLPFFLSLGIYAVLMLRQTIKCLRRIAQLRRCCDWARFQLKIMKWENGRLIKKKRRLERLLLRRQFSNLFDDLFYLQLLTDRVYPTSIPEHASDDEGN